MGDKRRRDLAKITNMLLSTVLDVAKAGAKDPGGILRAISELRGAASTSMGVALTEQSPDTSNQNSVLQALANAYRKSIKANDKRTARSILSVLVSSELTDKEVISLCSECSPIVVGDTVSVLLRANVRHNMIVLAVADEGIKVVTIANALSSQGENSDFDIVPAKNVRVLGLVTCTLDQIKVAKLHAAVHYPGAKVTSVITRAGGISPDRASFVADFLRDKTVCEASEASLVNSSRGIVYRLKQRRWPLWHRLVLLMLTANLQPVSWGHFWWLTSTSQYELLTADNCCCGICRDFGFDNYDELRDIITKLAGAIAAVSEGVVTIEVAELLTRVKHEEEFRRGVYASHLADSDQCGSHCLTMLLSSHCDERFRKLCTHGRGDGIVVDAPLTWEEHVRAKCGRNSKRSDWNGSCEVCAEVTGKVEISGNLEMCKYCNVVAHKLCIQRAHCDLPSHKDGSWACWDCVREIDSSQHNMSCDKCNESEYIVQDVHRMIQLLQSVEVLAAGARVQQANASVGGKGGNKCSRSDKGGPSARGGKGDEVGRAGEGSNNGRGGGGERRRGARVGGDDGVGSGSGDSQVDALHSEILIARLEEFTSKQLKYVSHLIRDRNQGCFKDLALDTLTGTSFYVLMDYWAKIPVAKRSTACCEGGQGQIGMSAHGAMLVYRNPSNAQRAQIDAAYGPVDWDLFGPSPEDGGVAFFEEHFNFFCDDAKQGTFHTQSEVEALTRLFLVGRPWLREERRAMVQSDNASNYRDATTEVNETLFGTRVFSAEGMGKDESDANTGVNKGVLKRYRDRGNALESSVDVLAGVGSSRIPGQTNAVIKIDRRNETPHRLGRSPVPHISNYAMWTISDECITFYESLDVSGSRLSIPITGRAVGFGPGHKISITDFNKLHSTQAQPTRPELLLPDGTNGASVKPNPKPRGSRVQKRASKKSSEALAAEKVASRAKRKTIEISRISDLDSGEAEQCPRCRKIFLTAGWFNRHSSAFCADRSESLADNKRARCVKVILQKFDALAIKAHFARISQLREVHVRLKGPGLVGLMFKPDPVGNFEVESIDVRSLSYLSSQVGAGFLLTSIDGEIADEPRVRALSKPLRAGEIVILNFKRPAPLLPLHGIGRKCIHKPVKYKMHPEQLAWLEKNVFKDGVPIMRDSVAKCAMQAYFSRRLRPDTHTPMWLDQDKIATWQAARVADEKLKRKLATSKARSVARGASASVDAEAPPGVAPKAAPNKPRPKRAAASIEKAPKRTKLEANRRRCEAEQSDASEESEENDSGEEDPPSSQSSYDSD